MTNAVRYGERIIAGGRTLGGARVAFGLDARAPAGDFRITGTVDELGMPGAYRVRLYMRASGTLVAEGMSGDDGAFVFDHLAYLDGGYFAIAHDHTAPLRNAAISDYLTPEPMPT